MTLTPDDKYIFLTTANGDLHKVCTTRRTIIKSFDSVHSCELNTVICTRDNKYIFVGTNKGLLQYKIENDELVKDHSSAFKGLPIWTIKSLPNSKSVYVAFGETLSSCWEWLIEEQRVGYQFNDIHLMPIMSIDISMEGHRLYTTCRDSGAKVFKIDPAETPEMIKEWKSVVPSDIFSSHVFHRINT